jgi:hypothetical protein
MSVAFDTLKFAQNLRDKANFSPAQAEGVSQAFSEAITDQLATRGDLTVLATKDDLAALGKATKDDLAALGKATKDDLAALGKATKDDIADLRKETKDDIADLREEMGAFRLRSKEDFARLEVKIEATRSEILRWMFGQTLLILGAVLAIGRIWH